MDEEDDPQQWDVFRRRSELEKARKTLGEISGRMDRFVQTEAKSLKGLFRPEMEIYRLKLKETAMKLMELDPSQWGIKAFDLHWRKGFYSTLKSAFKKEELDMEERSRVISLIWRGFSHYQGIISKLGIVPSDFNSSPIHGFSQPAQTSTEKASEEWARTVFYKCLLCLGDLARYFREMNCGGYLNIARRYYHQALIASSYKSGMPYNQLGRLSEEEYWGLPSAYYYLRSAMSEDRFDGAEINLKNLLTKNEKFYLKLNDEDKGQEETELFVVSLLHMMRCFLFEPDTKTSDLSEICQRVLTFFYLRIVKEGDELNSEVAMNAVAFLIAGIQYMESKKDAKPSFISLARAALLALFSNCVFKLLVDLKMELFGSEDIEDDDEEEDIEDEDKKNEYEVQVEDGDRKKSASRSILDRFRRKRNRYTSSTDENESDEFVDDDEDSCISEDEFTNSMSSDEDDFILSDNFMNSSDSEEDVMDEEDDDVVIQQSSVVCSTKDLAKTLGNHSLASCIRLLCLWVMTSPDVIETDEHSKIFWGRLSKVFNLVDFHNSNKYIENEQINESFDKVDIGSVMIEDFYTRGLKMFSTYHTNNLNWKKGYIFMDKTDLGLVRIKQLVEFKNWLEEIKKKPKFTNEKNIKSDGVNSDEEKRNALMESMAHLWLKQEVENLEEKESKMFSPYIIVDHWAIVKHIRTIKNIVAAKKFTVIIPSAVVQELDAMKRTHNGARIAIRWLEWQFKEGNPWLRAQKKYETTALEDIKYPKRKNKEAWHYFEILECCNYFTRLGSTRTVTLLSPQEFDMDVNPIELAKLIGIRIEHVKTFRHCIRRNKQRDVKT
uniref:Uncharacterized protein n=1 Tax=Lepeophtheirus salmonis TaxID=72036 RepID=A0A0K2U7J6_LEPSM